MAATSGYGGTGGRLGVLDRCPGSACTSSAPSCHQEVCSSLAGLALALPDIRAFRRRHPRISARPLRSVESGGRSSLVLGFRSLVDGGAADVVYDEQTLDVVGVHTVAG